MVQTCYYVLNLLWKWRVDGSIASVMASYSEYKQQRIISLCIDRGKNGIDNANQKLQELPSGSRASLATKWHQYLIKQMAEVHNQAS